ncbi:hypothetical protein [Niabella hibiscisoli]|nr:hypothetical protein [Niabella hibiscisoli]MCH5720045.1 hypothetical protein [Niabella hibiscisoli]
MAHITDVHIRPDYDAPNRFKNSLKQIVKNHQPDFFSMAAILFMMHPTTV